MGCVGWRETEPELPAAPMGTELPGLPQQRAVDAHTRAHLRCTPVAACVQAHGALAQPGTWATSRTPCSALQPRGGKGLLRWDPSAPQGAARAGEGRSRGSPRCHLHLQHVPSLCRVSQGHRALAGGDACWWQEEAGTLLAPLPVGDRAAGTWPPCVPRSRAPGEGLCPWLSLPQAPQALPASPSVPASPLPAPDVLGRGREQPRQLQSTRARCAGRTLRALRRLPSPRPVLIQPRHGTGRKDIPPVGTACTHGVIPSSLRGKPQGGCSRSPSPSAARAGPKEPCWDAACATPSPAVAPIPCWLPGQEPSWPEFSRLSVLGLSPAVTKPSYGRKSASEPRWMPGCLRLLPHCSLSATGTGSTEPPGMVFPSKWCRGTKLPHQQCLGDCSELC